MSVFRVALSGDFKKSDGSPAFPMFDLSPLEQNPNIEVKFVDPVDGRMSAESLLGFDALILLMPHFDKESIPKDGRLSIIARFGVGYDTVDVQACTGAGIAVCITPDGVRRPVAVTILTFILALAGRLFDKDRLTREGSVGFDRRANYMGMGLIGRTLGSIGIGNIGAEAFRIVAPLQMHHIAHDPYCDPEIARSIGVELVELDEVFSKSDFLCINTPLTEETHHVVNAERLGLMKPTAYLINTSRGPTVDQAALVEAIKSGIIAGAGLDVLNPEPPSVDDPILALDNVIVTPHALCWTDQCFAGIGASDIEQVLMVKNGQLPSHMVNETVADNPIFKARLSDYASS